MQSHNEHLMFRTYSQCYKFLNPAKEDIMTKPNTDKTFFQARLQKSVSGMLFPSGNGDWFIDKGYADGFKDDANKSARDNIVAKEDYAFNAFVEAQQHETGRYYNDLADLDLTRDRVNSTLSSDNDCVLEVMTAVASQEITADKPGNGKHIVYFPGADTYTQACFRDIAAAAKETGAQIHAFNFPGTGASTGKVLDSHDLINAGIAVVRDLVENQGVHIDDILLQGDCYGSAIAWQVKEEFKKQSNLDVRVVMNNSFSSFEAAVTIMLKSISWLPNFASDFLISFVGGLLKWIGMDVRPENGYDGITPYQCHIQHDGDQTLRNATLSAAVRIKQEDPNFEDPCPEEFRKTRNELAANHKVQVKPSAKERLGNKFGRDEFGVVNSHFADLCELEMHDGKTSAYEGIVNQFISTSNDYIANHGQDMTNYVAPKFLSEAHIVRDLSAEEKQEFAHLGENIDYVIDSGLCSKSPYSKNDDSDHSNNFSPVAA